MQSQSSRIFYFAYASNLLRERIQLRNPSALYKGTGLLKDYALSFIDKPKDYKADFVSSWFGASATVLESKGSETYGTIWTLAKEDIPALDVQESVTIGLYHPLDPLDVTHLETGETLRCRAYQALLEAPNGVPSPLYLDIIVRGAVQSKLPYHYVKQLRQQEHNNYVGPCDLYDSILKMMADENRNKFEVPALAARFP